MFINFSGPSSPDKSGILQDFFKNSDRNNNLKNLFVHSRLYFCGERYVQVSNILQKYGLFHTKHICTLMLQYCHSLIYRFLGLGFSCWLITCRLRLRFCEKRFPQMLHVKFFSPVWVTRWSFSFPEFLKTRKQNSQTNLLPDSCNYN